MPLEASSFRQPCNRERMQELWQYAKRERERVKGRGERLQIYLQRCGAGAVQCAHGICIAMERRKVGIRAGTECSVCRMLRVQAIEHGWGDFMLIE